MFLWGRWRRNHGVVWVGTGQWTSVQFYQLTPWGAEVLERESAPDLITTEMLLVKRHVLMWFICFFCTWKSPLSLNSAFYPLHDSLSYTVFWTVIPLSLPPHLPPHSAQLQVLSGLPWGPSRSHPRDVSVPLRNPLLCYQNTTSFVKDARLFRSYSLGWKEFKVFAWLLVLPSFTLLSQASKRSTSSLVKHRGLFIVCLYELLSSFATKETYIIYSFYYSSQFLLC